MHFYAKYKKAMDQGNDSDSSESFIDPDKMIGIQKQKQRNFAEELGGPDNDEPVAVIPDDSDYSSRSDADPRDVKLKVDDMKGYGDNMEEMSDLEENTVRPVRRGAQTGDGVLVDVKKIIEFTATNAVK